MRLSLNILVPAFLIVFGAAAAAAKSGKEARLPGEGTWRLRFRTLWAEGDGCGEEYMDVQVCVFTGKLSHCVVGGGLVWWILWWMVHPALFSLTLRCLHPSRVISNLHVPSPAMRWRPRSTLPQQTSTRAQKGTVAASTP